MLVQTSGCSDVANFGLAVDLLTPFDSVIDLPFNLVMTTPIPTSGFQKPGMELYVSHEALNTKFSIPPLLSLSHFLIFL